MRKRNEKFEQLLLEVISFCCEDVITTSAENPLDNALPGWDFED